MNAENVGAILDALGARFGATGAHLWAVLQRQAFVEFFTSLILLPVAVFLWVLWSRWPKKEGPYADNFDRSMAAVLLGLATLLLLCAIVGTAQGALNPEYYALHEVLSTLHGK